MKKISLFMLFIMVSVFTASADAQNPTEKQRESREQMVEKMAQNIAYELALDDKTSKRFIETYANYKKELWTAAPKRDKNRDRFSESEEQAGQNMRQRFERSQKILDIRSKYYKEFSKFMTQKQIEQMYDKEKKMMQRLKQRFGKKKADNQGKRATNKYAK